MKGTFQITDWKEDNWVNNENGAKKSHARIKQKYSGAIEGESEVQYLLSYQSSVSALFVGYEVISGRVNGKSGSMTLQHCGTFENGVASSEFIIVKGSGSCELSAIEGSGSFTSAESGVASYTLNLND